MGQSVLAGGKQRPDSQARHLIRACGCVCLRVVVARRRPDPPTLLRCPGSLVQQVPSQVTCLIYLPTYQAFTLPCLPTVASFFSFSIKLDAGAGIYARCCSLGMLVGRLCRNVDDGVRGLFFFFLFCLGALQDTVVLRLFSEGGMVGLFCCSCRSVVCQVCSAGVQLAHRGSSSLGGQRMSSC